MSDALSFNNSNNKNVKFNFDDYKGEVHLRNNVSYFVGADSKGIFTKFDLDGNGTLDTCNKDGKNEISLFMSGLREMDSDEDKNLTDEEIRAYLDKNNLVEECGVTGVKNLLVDLIKQCNAQMSDGKISQTNQASTGDCWLLSQMNTLSLTSWGKQAISDNIKLEESGDFKVNFPGVNEVIAVSKKEIKEAQGQSAYSATDLDALVLELAVEKYFNKLLDSGDEVMAMRVATSRQEQESYAEQGIKMRESILNGNPLTGKHSLQYLMFGNPGEEYYSGRCFTSDDNNVKQYISDENKMLEVLSLKADNPEDRALLVSFGNTDDNDKSNQIVSGHAYAVKDVIKDSEGNVKEIVLLNPWDSTSDITVSKDRFMQIVQTMGNIEKNPMKMDVKTVSTKIKDSIKNNTLRIADLTRAEELLKISGQDMNQYLTELGGLKTLYEYIDKNNLDGGEKTNSFAFLMRLFPMEAMADVQKLFGDFSYDGLKELCEKYNVVYDINN